MSIIFTIFIILLFLNMRYCAGKPVKWNLGEDGRWETVTIRTDWWTEEIHDFQTYEFELTRKEYAECRMANFLAIFTLSAPADHMSDDLEELICGMKLESEPERFRKIS